MAKFKIIALAVTVLLLLIVVFQNTQDATVRFLVVKVTMPLALMLAIFLAAGVLCGLGAAMMLARRGGGNRNPPKV